MRSSKWGVTVLLSLWSVSVAGVAAAEQAAPAADAPQEALQLVKEPRALASLRAMSDRLSATPSFTVAARNVVPMLGPNGQWVSLVGTARVTLQRPDKLFIERGGDQLPMKVYYDGKSLTLYEPVQNLYAVAPARATLDAALTEVLGAAIASFPYLEVLLSDPYAAMTAGLQGALYVGETTLDGVRTDHLALVSPGVDWEIWIGSDDRLPHLVQARYVDLPKTPTITTQFHDWNLKPQIAAGTFALDQATRATQIEYAPPAAPEPATREGGKP